MPYVDPCFPCEYLDWYFDEETGKSYHLCNRTDNDVCWIEEWFDEQHHKKSVDKN